MLRTFLAPIILSIGMATQVSAACMGTNLFDAMPAADRAPIENAAHAAPWAKGLIFQATKKAEKITLVGTYHLPDQRHAQLVDAMAPYMDDASALLVEMGPAEEAAFIRARDEDPTIMFITSGPTLSERLSPDDWKQLADAAESRGVPAALATRLKPAYLSLMLAIPACAQDEIATGAGGLDKALMARATERGLPIMAVEPWNTLFTVFEQFSTDDEDAMLRGALLGGGTTPDAAATIADLYFAREPRMIWELSEKWARDAGMDVDDINRQMDLTERLLMTERNHAWMPVIQEAAAQGHIVVAVGALHMSGDHGLLALLRESGWNVKRLD